MRSLEFSVRVDAAIALADAMRRNVVIYIADVEPQVFTPSDYLLDSIPIQLAFYEPGHYRAVVSSTTY